LKGLECYKHTQMKACNTTVPNSLPSSCLRNHVVASRL